MNLNLPSSQQLRYLVAIADKLHFGRAADECSISQPALSAQISKLEQTLGTQLVERTTRRVLLTPAGQEVADKSRYVLAQLEELVTTARRGQKPLGGSFYFGVIPTVAPYFLPTLLSAVRLEYPELRLFLREEQTSRILESLLGGKLDAALLALPISTSGLKTLPIIDEPFRLVVPRGHRFEGVPFVEQGDLAGEEVLLLEDGHCFRDQALAVCTQAGALETPSIRANNISTLVQMVANGLGVTLLPASAIPAELRGMNDVVEVAFTDPQPARTLGLVWRATSPQNEDLQLFSNLLARHVHEVIS